MYYQRCGRRFSFVYYDPVLKKNVRLKKSEHPAIRLEDEAKAFVKAWEAKHDARRIQAKRILEWKTKFVDWNELLETYLTSRKIEAPFSSEAQVFYLNYYVLPFFVDSQKLNNIDLWPTAFENFRDHLLTAQGVKVRKPLAWSTRNGIIKALNAFLLAMYRRGLLSARSSCRLFPNYKTRRREEESLIDETTAFQIRRALPKLTADFFHTLLKTGLRLSEALGLSLADLFAGELEDANLRHSIELFGLKSYGYLALESQPASLKREGNEILRKPLKGHKRICHEHSRIIPIFDEEAWLILAARWNEQLELFRKGVYGEQSRNYLLFDGLDKNTVSNHLRAAQKGPKLFTAHCCRHTYSTWLAGTTGGSYQLCQMILGHSKLEMTLRYIHLNAQVSKNIRSKEQLKSFLPLATDSPEAATKPILRALKK